MGAKRFGASQSQTTPELEDHPWFLLFLSPPFSPPTERGRCDGGNASMADVGLPSGDLSMESILFELAMICFSLQTLLFSIIDLPCLLSPVRHLWPWFAPGAVKGLPETVWHCDWIQFPLMFAYAVLFCLEMVCATAGGVQSPNPFRHASHYSNGFSPSESLACMAPAVPGRGRLSKLASLLQEVGQCSFRMKLGGPGEDISESARRNRNDRVREGEEKGGV